VLRVPRERKGDGTKLSIKFFAYFLGRDEIVLLARFPPPLNRAKGKEGPQAHRGGRLFLPGDLKTWRSGEATLDPDLFWLVIAGGCVGYLIFATGLVKVRRH
jgi:hypothetical protein